LSLSKILQQRGFGLKLRIITQTAGISLAGKINGRKILLLKNNGIFSKPMGFFKISNSHSTLSLTSVFS